MIKYSDIRKINPYGNFRTKFIVDYLCMPFSPYLSIFFVKKQIRPNTITLLMIISGVIGAFLFCLPIGIFKLLGLLFYYLWYILDCSDGEVARVTKTFSKYGREMDYMAHLICHPLMNLSLFISYVQLEKYNLEFLSFIFVIFISVELISRMIIMFSVYSPRENKLGSKTSPIKWYKYIVIQFAIYPNFILLFPLIYFLDFWFDINTSWILLVWLALHSIICLKQIIDFLLYFYRS